MKIDIYDIAAACRNQHNGCENSIDLITEIVKVETQKRIEQAENRLRSKARVLVDELSVALRR